MNDQILDYASESIISRSDGLTLLCFFAIFLYYSAGIARKVEGQEDILPAHTLPLPRAALLTAAGMAGLTLGGMWIVGSASKIGVALGMSDSMVGLTIVAIGTSLPELATSAMAAYRRNVDIAVGNVVGSNIFNIFLVLGVSSTIRPLPFTAENIDIAVMIFSNLALFATMFTRKKRSLDKEEGFFLLACYVAYMSYVVWRG